MNAIIKILFPVITVIAEIVSPFITCAQVKFQEYYGVKPSNYEVSHGAARALDGGYFFAGETHDNAGLVPWDLYVIKTDSAGNKIWSKRYHNVEGSNHPAGNIIATADSGFALAPMTNSGDFRIVKFDKSGNFIWSKQYGAGYGSPRNIIQTLDGGYAIVGDEFYFTPNVFKSYVVKIDAAGNIQWDKALYNSANTLRGCDIVQTADSSFVICGIDQVWANPANVFLYKLSKSGVVLWVKSIGNTELEEAYGIKKTIDNGFIIAGNTSINGTDVLLIKTDSVGTIQWSNAYGTTGYEGNIISHNIETDADGGYSYFGYTMSGPIGSADLMHIKTDASGNILWTRTYGSIYSESGYASGFQTSDGGYLMTGRRAGNLNGDLLAIKTDASGFCGCSEATIFLTTTAVTLTSTTVAPLVITGGTATIKTYTTVNIYNDSTIVCLSSAPLPVELVSFYGENKNNINHLYWKTASETNNNYFEIERSSIGNSFEKIGTIEGNGNSTQNLNYKFDDTSPYFGINYYRLKQVDFNGDFKYSKVIALKNSSTEIGCYVYSKDEFGIFFLSCDEIQTGILYLFDMRGILMEEKHIENATDKIIVNLTNYSKGMFIIRFFDGKNYKIFKLIKE